MIISHKHKYIFLRTRKTAGTSIEIYLSKFCGDRDVITPISPDDEKLRSQFGMHPQNYTESWTQREFYWELRRSIRNKRLPNRKKVIYSQHTSAQVIKKKVGDEIWNNYFKFCFVRNPWDRAISRYYWDREIHHKGKVHQLDDSLELSDPGDNLKYYTIGGETALDYIGKFETMAKDLEIICDKIGIPFEGEIPRTKSGVRRDKRHYSEILSPQQAAFIEQRCHKDIELFDYKF